MLNADLWEKENYMEKLAIHGGPKAASSHIYFHEFQVMASRGYAVITSNPRGSDGRALAPGLHGERSPSRGVEVPPGFDRIGRRPARLHRARIVAYDSGAHTATVTLLEGPTASIAGVPCADQCLAADLTAGQQCLVLITADSQAVLVATY